MNKIDCLLSKLIPKPAPTDRFYFFFETFRSLAIDWIRLWLKKVRAIIASIAPPPLTKVVW